MIAEDSAPAAWRAGRPTTRCSEKQQIGGRCEQERSGAAACDAMGASPGSSYAEESLVIGSKVRVRTGAQSERITGTVVAVEPDELRLQVKGEWDARALRWDEMRRLDISIGRNRRRAAAIGALAGVAVAGGTTLWLRSEMAGRGHRFAAYRPCSTDVEAERGRRGAW
jgi:hypothetical protein